ncbi:MAG: hypothetical protein AMXMBFR53_19120 [Gemmatimonadota bacterium]
MGMLGSMGTILHPAAMGMACPMCMEWSTWAADAEGRIAASAARAATPRRPGSRRPAAWSKPGRADLRRASRVSQIRP